MAQLYDMQISVVSGTYNRLPHLKKMIDSVRQSIGGKIDYEIIIVDGGSTDGTLDWLTSQRDVRLIAQGQLLGAVNAFNAGAQAANGRYVVLANDDILFIDESILNAYTFMEDNPKCGVGCFYQDRGNREWHVERMPAIEFNRQISAPYGQVCIVPWWLGDKVGWWGDYLHTYGGDNELSCNVLELGYQTLPVQCSCIHDLRVEDDLRRINGGDPTQTKPHPDSEKWKTKWSRPDGKVGPILPVTWHEVHPYDRLYRILYAPIYEPHNMLQRQTKTGLFDALYQHTDVLPYECDYMSCGMDKLFDVASAFKPDVFLLQIQDANWFTPQYVSELKQRHPNAKFMSWNGDYHPENLLSGKYMDVMKLMDIASFVTADIKKVYNDYGINYQYWQIGWEHAEYDWVQPQHDVVFLGNGYSPARMALAERLRSLDLNIGLYGNWPSHFNSQANLYDFDAGCGLYRNAKIAISDQQWPDATGYVSNRLFQAMAAGGCMVLQQQFKGMEQYLGIKNGEHIVTWKSLDDLESQIVHYISNNDERTSIAELGHEYVVGNHAFINRVQELWEMLDELE